MHSNRKKSAILISTVILSGSAVAQTESGIHGLEEIVVTAQRREQNIQDVPFAVSAVTADMADKMGVQDIFNLKQVVPSFTFNRQGSGAQPFIRGVGNQSTTIGNEPSVAIYFDDQYLPTAHGALFEFNDIESVEVLKGPQGTLFGRNATGGVLHVHTKQPSQETAADVNFTYANYDKMTAQFFGTTGLSDTIAGSISAFYMDQGNGWGDNVTTGNDQNLGEAWGVRGKLLIEPDDTLSILLAGQHSELESDIGQAHRVVMGLYGRNGVRPEDVGVGFYDGISSVQDVYEVDFDTLTAKVTKDLEHSRLVSVTGYAESKNANIYDISASNPAYLWADYDQNSESYSQEIQLLSPEDSDVSWIIGGFYLHEQADYRAVYLGEVFARFGPGVFQTGDATQKTDSYSVFAESTFEMMPDTNLTIGVRYTEDDRKLTDAGGTLPAFGVVAGPFHDDKKFTSVTGRIALDHHFSEDFMGYVAYNRGFKSGVYSVSSYNSSSTGPVEPVNPEELNAYSIGFKSTMMDNTVRFNAEGFYYDYSNIQVQNNLPTGGGAKVVNGGEATIMGVEADLTVVPAEGLTITAAVVVLDSEYDEFKLGPTYFPQPPNDPVPVPSGCSFTNYPIGGTNPMLEVGCDLDGNDLLQAIPFSASLTAVYSIPSEAGIFDIAASLAYSDDYSFSPDNLYTTDQDSLTLINASITWTSDSEQFDVRLWGNNLTDEEYYSYLAHSATSGSKGGVAPPRTYGLTLGMHF